MTKCVGTIVLSAGALMLLVAAALAQESGSWSTRAPVRAPLNEVALAAVNGKIHVVGGSVLGVAGPYHQQYDPATDQWQSRAVLPRGLDHIGAGVLNGKIYTVGGFTASVHANAQNAAFEYDPATDSWRTLPPVKAGRGSVGVAVLDGKVHAVGGRDPSGATVATHEVYDPATD